MGIPHGHWKVTTLVSGLGLGGIVAPMVLVEFLRRSRPRLSEEGLEKTCAMGAVQQGSDSSHSWISLWGSGHLLS